MFVPDLIPELYRKLRPHTFAILLSLPYWIKASQQRVINTSA